MDLSRSRRHTSRHHQCCMRMASLQIYQRLRLHVPTRTYIRAYTCFMFTLWSMVYIMPGRTAYWRTTNRILSISPTICPCYWLYMAHCEAHLTSHVAFVIVFVPISFCLIQCTWWWCIAILTVLVSSFIITQLEPTTAIRSKKSHKVDVMLLIWAIR